MTIEHLQNKIINWAEEKEIFTKATSAGQYQKTLEEVGELGRAIMEFNIAEKNYIYSMENSLSEEVEECNASRDRAKLDIQDAIGDVMVTLIIQAKMQSIDFPKSTEATGLFVGDRGRSLWDHYTTLLSSCGELLCSIVADGRKAVITMHVAAVFLRLQRIAEHFNLTPEECLASAYEVIANRKGKIINGVFVKDE